jgi:hypothetical protein
MLNGFFNKETGIPSQSTFDHLFLGAFDCLFQRSRCFREFTVDIFDLLQNIEIFFVTLQKRVNRSGEFTE